ncbi:thermostable hemolysin [Vibrio sp. AK197]
MENLFSVDGLYLDIIDTNHCQWNQAKHYIHERYAKAFDAQLNDYMPAFMALMKEQEFVSLCGFRGAQSGELFLEQYLDIPADVIVSQQFSTAVKREQLVEFGQLASFNKGLSLVHFFLVAQALVARNYQWCIFTATDPLYAMMKRFGLSLVTIADADPNRILDATSIWGNYYQHQPRIVAGHLVSGLAHLNARLASSRSHAVGER